MNAYLAEQSVVFLQSCLLGAVLGMLYDVFRILRIAFPVQSKIVFIQDLIFWLVSTLVTFFFVLASLDGVVRVFLLVGELLGGVLYHFTLGELLMRLAQAIIDAISAFLRLLYRFLLRPIVRLLYAIAILLLRPWRWLGEKLKKMQWNMKFRLKVRRIVLYNLYKGRMGKNRIPKHEEKAAYAQAKKNNETA